MPTKARTGHAGSATPGPRPHERPVSASVEPDAELAFAAGVIRAEADAVASLGQRLGPDFIRALDVLDRCVEAGGTVLVTGLGKSGLIGAKLAATLASLGIPAHSVHPAEAAHGDLGRFRSCDAVIAISNSGETDEVVNVAAILRQDGVPIVAIVGGGVKEDSAPSSLERLATVTLRLGVGAEAGDGRFHAPTCSTTATAALGDAIALSLARRRNFTEADFARRHPGGALGGLLRNIIELLRFRVGENLPLIPDTSTVADALRRAAAEGRRPGAILLVDGQTQRLTGIFTDGDLRRLVLKDAAELARPIAQVMTRAPRTLPHTALVQDALRLIREHRQDEIPVVDDAGRPLGILDVQDLVAMRLIKD